MSQETRYTLRQLTMSPDTATCLDEIARFTSEDCTEIDETDMFDIEVNL